MIPPTDPIYRDSACALEALPGDELLSWMADLMTIRCLPNPPYNPRRPILDDVGFRP